MRRVVVTGMGCVTPHGVGVEPVWRQLVAGQSAAGPITLFDPSGYPVRIAAEVPAWDHAAACRRWDLPGDTPRQTLFLLEAAAQAADQAALQPGTVPPSRLGVILGCGEVFPTLERVALEVLGPLRSVSDAALGRLGGGEVEWHWEPSTPAILLAGKMQAQGPVINYVTACVSSTMAIGEARNRIAWGQCDVVFCGGAHSMIHPLGLTGFCRLNALSRRNETPTEAARPFDRTRDGFVMGEGGVVLVLEAYEHARRRGVEALAEVTGYAGNHDAYRITDPQPDGRAAARCIRQALRDAGIGPEQVDYICAHGSGTPANDWMETLAIKRALGSAAFRIPVSSIKSMSGHLTTACGALETMVCVQVLRSGVIPPTINYREPDPQCDLDYVPNEARQSPCRHVINNSFGFGGQNVVLVLSRI